jgi:hypothetical protein
MSPHMKRKLAACVAVGVSLLLAAPGAAIASASTKAGASPSASPSATASAGPSATPTATKSAKKAGSGYTVTGPHMYNPNTGANNSQASTVTVSQVKNLANQMVEVSWTNFTASDTVVYDPTETDYPVMVAECDTAHPTNPDQCFDATNGGVTETEGAYGPSNAAYAITQGNGRGSADVQIYTGDQNQFLGCGTTHKCSLVIVDAQGGNTLDTPADCADHSNDNGFLDTGEYEFTGLEPAGQPSIYCSWIKRIVVPLSFAPSASGCPNRSADFTAAGSPMLADAMEQWEAGICEGSSPISVQYNGSLNEYEARQEFAEGLTDVAFATQPISSGTTTTRKYTYAPVAVSAVSVAYWVDNSDTGQPYTNMKLDPRLVAKLLTTSYAFGNDGCSASDTTGCDGNVDGNPTSLYYDPEFKQLNPSITDPANENGSQIPTIEAGQSDMTWAVSSWIAANKDASSFLSGTFDQWGMHINTAYLGVQYPTDEFTTQDSYPAIAFQYSPVYPLSKVAWYQALNWVPGTEDTKDPTTGNYDDLPQESVGDRDLFAILDQADAARFAFPVAAIENHAGAYVEPTNASMEAALNDMTVNSDGTESFNQDSDDRKAYPLTMIIYAIVPTSGISHAKAEKIAQFLDYMAGQGQTSGVGAGQLADGYLPLTQKLRQQTLAAAQEVLDQSGDTTASTATKTSTTGTASPSAKPSPSASPKPSPTTSPESAHQIAVSFSGADSVGMSWLILALLIGGITFAITGPAALVYANPAARRVIRNGARRVSKIRIRRKISS